MLSQMKRVKKLLPDHSASHWYPSEQVRKKSAGLFLDVSQMSLDGAKVDKDPQKGK